MPPLIDARHLLAYLGDVPFFFGQQLAKKDESVVDVAFDESSSVISGTILEDDQQFVSTITVVRSATGWTVESTDCSCNKGSVCPHVAALALTANKIANQPRPSMAETKRTASAWSTQVNTWFEEPEPGPSEGLLGSPNDPVVAMALQFKPGPLTLNSRAATVDALRFGATPHSEQAIPLRRSPHGA